LNGWQCKRISTEAVFICSLANNHRPANSLRFGQSRNHLNNRSTASRPTIIIEPVCFRQVFFALASSALTISCCRRFSTRRNQSTDQIFMPETFQAERRVEFRDTDAAGIVHFSVFFAYMEEAEHAMLRSLGLSVHTYIDGETVSWPRVAARCEYLKSIKFEQVVTINVSLERIGSKSLTFNHVFKNSDDETVATGTITTVCCQIPQKTHIDQPLKPVPIQIPASFVQALTPFLAQ